MRYVALWARLRRTHDSTQLLWELCLLQPCDLQGLVYEYSYYTRREVYSSDQSAFEGGCVDAEEHMVAKPLAAALPGPGSSGLPISCSSPSVPMPSLAPPRGRISFDISCSPTSPKPIRSSILKL